MPKHDPTNSRRIITSVRWTEDEFTRLQLCLAGSGQTSLSDLIREATLAHLHAVLHSYDKTKESNNERKERNYKEPSLFGRFSDRRRGQSLYAPKG